MYKQRGMTFIGLVLIIAGVVFVATIGIKLYPAYMEFFTIKKAIKRIADDPSFAEMSPKQVMESFNKSASIDNITAISGDDLIIESGESKPVITVDYQVVVPIAGNVSALLDFNTSTSTRIAPAPGPAAE